MKTLFEIIEEVKGNQEPTKEEMFYAIVAMDALSTFDGMSLRALASNESKFRTPQFEWEESFRRWKVALNKSPKEYIGWDNDPKNLEYRKRRTISIKLCEKIMNKANLEVKND